MILSINTSTDTYQFALFGDGVKKEFSAKRKDQKDALFFITQFLNQNNVKLKDLKAIAVFRGPGSHTGLRVGISIANALAFTLKIPIVGFLGEKYQKEPLKMAKETFEKLEKGKLKTGNFVKPVYTKE
jgi:tRNA threonylcarbamoyl adenosine modification protein YeaZ